MTGPKILTIDIETMPAEVVTFSTFKPIIGHKQIKRPVEIGCFAAKWYDKATVFASSIHFNGREEMVQKLRDTLDAADIVVTYNGDKFDIPHIRTAILLAGLGPPSPFKSVDLYKVARTFRFMSNKLDYVASQLGVGAKLPNEGIELWMDCMAGKSAAWREMIQYNKQDIVITEAAYTEFLPSIKNHPNFGLWTGETVCPKCGSTDIQRRGYKVESAMVYPQFMCKQCKGWSRGMKGERLASDLR